MGAPPFQRFGWDHLAALGLTAAVATTAAILVRRRPGGVLARTLAPLLALLLAGSLAVYGLGELARGRLAPWQLLPLHLCDLLVFVAAGALLTRRQLLYELLYFWAGAGALLAMVTPDVPRGFPDPYFVVFFGFHAGVVLAAALLTFGHGLRPRPGSAWRIFGLTAGYAALVGLVDVALGANFLYLRHKPAAPTLLDALGPWPVYIGSAALLALVLFHALELPWLARRRAPGRMKG